MEFALQFRFLLRSAGLSLIFSLASCGQEKHANFASAARPAAPVNRTESYVTCQSSQNGHPARQEFLVESTDDGKISSSSRVWFKQERIVSGEMLNELHLFGRLAAYPHENPPRLAMVDRGNPTGYLLDYAELQLKNYGAGPAVVVFIPDGNRELAQELLGCAVNRELLNKLRQVFPAPAPVTSPSRRYRCHAQLDTGGSNRSVAGNVYEDISHARTSAIENCYRMLPRHAHQSCVISGCETL